MRGLILVVATHSRAFASTPAAQGLIASAKLGLKEHDWL
jgi:hypothetical protein